MGLKKLESIINNVYGYQQIQATHRIRNPIRRYELSQADQETEDKWAVITYNGQYIVFYTSLKPLDQIKGTRIGYKIKVWELIVYYELSQYRLRQSMNVLITVNTQMNSFLEKNIERQIQIYIESTTLQQNNEYRSSRQNK